MSGAITRSGGIYVVIRGDYSKFQQDLQNAAKAAKAAGGQIANALGGSVKRDHSTRAVQRLTENLMRSSAAAQVNAKALQGLNGVLGEVAAKAGISGSRFSAMQQQMLGNMAALNREKAFAAIRRDVGLSNVEMVRLRASLGDVTGAVKTMGRAAEGSFSNLLNMRNALIGGMAGYALQDVTKTSMQFDTYRRSFNAISGSQAGGADEMAFVRAEAERLGQDLFALADSYRGLSAAAKSSGLTQAQVRDVFSAVGEASTTLGLTSDQTKYSLYALQQMLSKGVVSMEELRRQLGDALPGSFAAAARAMDVTEAQLMKMIRDGEVISKDFLPKFATELRKTFGSGFPEAAQAAAREVERLGNTFKDAKNTIGEAGLLDGVTNAANKLNEALKSDLGQKTLKMLGSTIGTVVENIDLLAIALGGRAISSVGAYVKALGGGILISKKSAAANVAMAESALATAKANMAKVTSNNALVPAIRAVAAAELQLAHAQRQQMLAGFGSGKVLTGFKGALGGLIGILGGPWGAALTAGAIGYSHFSQKAAESSAVLEKYIAIANRATGQTDELGKKINQSAQALKAEAKAALSVVEAEERIIKDDLFAYIANAEGEKQLTLTMGVATSDAKREIFAYAGVLENLQNKVISVQEAYSQLDAIETKFGRESGEYEKVHKMVKSWEGLNMALAAAQEGLKSASAEMDKMAHSANIAFGQIDLSIGETYNLYRQFGSQLSSQGLFDFTDLVKGLESSQEKVAKFYAEMTGPLEAHRNKLRENLNLDNLNIGSKDNLRQQIAELSREIEGLEQDSTNALMRIKHDHIAKMKVLEEENINTVKRSVKERQLAELEYYGSSMQQAIEAGYTFKSSTLEAEAVTITALMKIISKLKETTAEGSVAGKALLVAITAGAAVSGPDHSAAKKEEIETQLKKDIAALNAEIAARKAVITASKNSGGGRAADPIKEAAKDAKALYDQQRMILDLNQEYASVMGFTTQAEILAVEQRAMAWKEMAKQIEDVGEREKALAQITEMTARAMEKASGQGIYGFKHALEELSVQASNSYEQMAQLTKTAFTSIEDSLVSAAMQADSFRGAMANMARNVAEELFRMAIRVAVIKPLVSWVGSLFGGGFIGSLTAPAAGHSTWLGGGGLFPSAKGNVFSSPGLHQYANTIVDRPTMFAFAKGAGLMGEAGPEAIMPLSRDSSGRLGVKAQGGGSAGDINVYQTLTVNIEGGGNQPVDESMIKKLSQTLRESTKHVVNETLANHMRPGGLLAGRR